MVASRCPRSSRCGDRRAVQLRPGHQRRGQFQRRANRVEGVEQRRLVLLQIAVVGQRQALDQHQQRLQAADHPGRLAANQLQHVRVDLLRHDRRPGAKGLRQLEEVELHGRPEDPLFRPSAEVLGDHRQAEGELQHEVAIARGVEAVGRHLLEAQPLGHVVAVDRQAGARQGRGAEGQAVGPPPAVGQPLPIALELLAIGQPVMRGQDRLGTLQVGIAGQDHVGIGIAAADQRPLHVRQPLINFVNRLADPKPQVGRDLIVAAAGRVQFAADVAEAIDRGPSRCACGCLPIPCGTGSCPAQFPGVSRPRFAQSAGIRRP